MKKWLWAVIVALVLCVIVAGFYFTSPDWKAKQALKDDYPFAFPRNQTPGTKLLAFGNRNYILVFSMGLWMVGSILKSIRANAKVRSVFQLATIMVLSKAMG